MKEQDTQHDHYLREHKDDAEISRLAGRLAPPEEIGSTPLRGEPVRDGGRVSILDPGSVKIPNDFGESEEGKNRILGLEPVILVIVLLMTAFIAFIAYLIYITPTA